MHTLFNIDFNSSAGVVKLPDWIYIRDNLLKSLDTFTTYYRNNTTSVKSNHLLVKILQNIAVSQTLELNKYYNAVDAMADNLSMAMGLTSPISKGKIFNNVFYGANSNEIIINVDGPFSAEYVDKNWQSVSSVRVLRHDRTNLALNPLKGDDRYRSEISIVSINIPLLAVQYRAFRNAEKLISDNDTMRSAMQFVAMYVLPNMLASHLDHAIVNRFKSMVLNLPLEKFDSATPFFQLDLTNRVDKVLRELVDRFSTTKCRFEVILKSIQTISKDNAFELMKIPGIAFTRQVNWALVVSRLKMLETLFVLNDLSETNENQANMNRIIRQAIYYRSDNSINYGLTPDIYLDVQKTIDKLVSLAKNDSGTL